MVLVNPDVGATSTKTDVTPTLSMYPATWVNPDSPNADEEDKHLS